MVEIESAVLTPPPVISMVGDTDCSHCLTNTLATCNGDFDLLELLSTCSGLCPFPGISASLQYIQYLIFQLDTFVGGRSRALAVLPVILFYADIKVFGGGFVSEFSFVPPPPSMYCNVRVKLRVTSVISDDKIRRGSSGKRILENINSQRFPVRNRH